MPTYDLTDLDHLLIHAAAAEIVTWGGRRALKLTDGLVVFPGSELGDGVLEVRIAAEGPGYPGIVFRVADRANYELAYAQPHTSGLWDAIQYDPVFHASNTWQLYHGPAFQKTATVPTGVWFDLRIAVQGHRAAISVDDQQPLIVDRLAHPHNTGLVGVWTYRPALFCDFRVSDAVPVEEGETISPPGGAVDGWFMDGFGRVMCEPHGVLNLNRYLPRSLGEAFLTRQFELSTEQVVEIALGFSDELTLQVDDTLLFEGSQTFTGFEGYAARGYVTAEKENVRHVLSPGVHTLAAHLKVTEGFGWGLTLSLRGDGIRLLPVF
jgi:hypothetical protein